MTPTAGFVRGDVNGDGRLNLSDAIAINNALYLGTKLPCLDAADLNDDGLITDGDAPYLLSYLFKGGRKPAGPFPERGGDPTIDLLGCRSIPVVNRVAPAVDQPFMRGDVDNDGRLTQNDSIYVLTFLFQGGKRPSCLDAADVNDDGFITEGDAKSLQGYIFLGRPKVLPAPYETTGEDPTADDSLDCVSYTGKPPTRPVVVTPPAPQLVVSTVPFRRGDADGNGRVELYDYVRIINYIQQSQPIPCLKAADVDDNGKIEQADFLDLNMWMWLSAFEIPAPGPAIAGLDPTPDTLSCEQYPAPPPPAPKPKVTAPVAFRRGDADGNGRVEFYDYVRIINYIQQSEPISCLDAADVDDNGKIEQADFLDLNMWMWQSAFEIPAPGPHTLGVDPTPDDLGCVKYSAK